MLDSSVIKGGPAATILTEATLAGGEPGRSAVALGGDGRILAIGASTDLAPLRGPGCRMLSAEGNSVWPAFHDAHMHPLAGGMALSGCDLHAVHDLTGYEHRVRAAAAGLGPGEWLTGGGWFGDVFDGGRPHRLLLDRWVPDHPTVLTSHDAHGVWANTAALTAAGIGPGTPDPAGGRVGRDEDGSPDGLLYESAADLVGGLLAPPTASDLDAAMRSAERHLFSLGIAGWQDAIVGDYLSFPNPLQSYRRLHDAGLLRARVTGALWWDRSRGIEQIAEFIDVRRSHGRGRLRFDAVKIMQDGICENCTGAMLEPYETVPAAGVSNGDSLIDPEELGRIVTALDRTGFSVHFHGVGDRAVRECLDAVEAAAGANGPSGLRHQIAHLDVVDPADIPRFAALGVVANIQPLWARADKEIVDRKLPLLGERRAAAHFPFRSLLDTGAAMAMGSDWPVSSPDPLWGMYTAVTRTAPPEDPHGVLPSSYTAPMNADQRLELSEALYAYTSGAASANGYGAETGALAPGQAGDVVVLDRNVSTTQELAGARVTRTLVSGETVFEA